MARSQKRPPKIATNLSVRPTRTVAPMIAVKRFAARPITRLNPILAFDDVEYVVVVQALAAAPIATLGAVVGNLSARRGDLVAALDLLFTGV